MLGILLPFWIFNVFGSATTGKKIFMGDTGALTLGYLVSFLFIYMASGAGCTFPREMLIIGLATMLVPMLDIVRVVMARIRNHRNPFLPDKNHIHHKLLRTGIGPHLTMGIIVSVSLLMVLVTLAGVWYHIPSTWIFLLDVAVWLAFDYSVNYFIHRTHSQRFEK
jgi:UDP-N-acetylmuramyl pentapeptide phosphotransferase/UDP-N-acetylglucosamine-1-phosphate transferase